MARRCELTGKNALVGNKVSHANNKTKTRFMPNLCDVSLMSDVMGLTYRMRVSAIALKSVEHVGGLDNFLMKADNEKLSDKALRLKRSIARKLEAAKAAAVAGWRPGSWWIGRSGRAARRPSSGVTTAPGGGRAPSCLREH